MLTVDVLASRENCLAIGPGHELSSIDSREFSRLSWKSRSACTAVVTLLDRVNLRKLGREETWGLVPGYLLKCIEVHVLFVLVDLTRGVVSSSQRLEELLGVTFGVNMLVATDLNLC